MNRLQKKCFFVAGGMHGLLALILLIGPAFVSSNNKSENVPELDFVPFKTVDALVSGGGDPKGGTPPPPPVVLPTPPTPAPVIDKAPPPEPVKPVAVKEVAPPKQVPDSLELPKKTKPRIEISDKPVVRNFDKQAAAKAKAKAKATAEAKAAAEQNRRIASAINSAASSMSEGFSDGVSMPVLKGPAAVKRLYTVEWIVPDGITDDSATVTAEITIARNGEVLAHSIVSLSGNSLVDHSVKATLDRVTTAPPLPDDAKEDKRTVTINFNVKAKLGQG